jgi:ABC-type sugar transport system ATPase subunit
MIALDRVTYRIGSFALPEVSFAVPAGGYAAVVGRTGCGKTTLLELVTGLRRPTAGVIRLRGVDVTGLPAPARRLGYVPQDAVPFPALTVRRNLGFALDVRGATRVEIDARVSELAAVLDLGPLLDRPAVGLSGGEAKRVALGRALAFSPDVLLLDEPLSGVDEATKTRLLALLDSLKGTATVLHVSHDPADVDRLADVVLRL